MKPIFWPAMLGLCGLACLHAGDTVAPAPSPSAVTVPAPAQSGRPVASARFAVERAMGFLQRDAEWWLKGGEGVPGGGGCVSCHHVGFALWSHREATRAGIGTAISPASADGLRALEEQAFTHVTEKRADGYPYPWSQLLLAREKPAGTGQDDPRWRALLGRLVDAQNEDGSWAAVGQFPSQKRPEEESDAVVTLWVLQALGTVDDLAPPVRRARDRAWAWVQARKPGVSNEWLLARLLVERQLGSPADADKALARLLTRQRPDGGWRWLADADQHPSDALSTGQALYALRLAGLPPDHPALLRGADYLLRTQNPDGTWLVPSTLISNKDGEKIAYIYKYWGTAWATLGLARTLPSAPSLPRAYSEAGAHERRELEARRSLPSVSKAPVNGR